MVRSNSGSLLVEILIAIGLFAAFAPALISGVINTRMGEPQQRQRLLATAMLQESQEVLRTLREKGWDTFSINGIFHPSLVNNNWTLVAGTDTVGDFSRSVKISDVYRDSVGNIVSTGTSIYDPSTKEVSLNISWQIPKSSSVGSTFFLTRYLDNLAYSETSFADFSPGLALGTTVSPAAGGEITLGYNNKAKWCSPEVSGATIDLPDGPPVAVAATASAVSVSTPNDVFVATAPDNGNSIKMAYVNVTANSDPPVPSLAGKFTLDPGQYSSSDLVPTGLGFDNLFRTNDIKYYTSPGGNLYALIATNMPHKEVIAIQIKSGGSASYQDPANKIHRYWTFFNTRQYQGDTRSTPNQDQAPFGYGAVALAVSGDRGYVASSGYLYVFDLSSIDSKNATNGLDMVGCRIELDGYDCSPGTGVDRKYSANQTGTSWSDTTSPAHNDCSDGGNIELYADNDIYPVTVGNSRYIYVAIGAGINPEFGIVNVTNVPSSSTSPRINNSSCGRISGGNSGWRRISTLDFNSQSGTEEAANSVFAKSDGSRAYISSNGGIDANGNGSPDSWQLYIINTSNKSSPQFLSGTPSTGATSGYYYGTFPNSQLYPRRSLTVLNGQRAILVGKDGTADANDSWEYQVTNIENESSPSYCGGVNFDSGFNDLTSVSEADSDNYVYMVANTQDHELKIIQGGPDSGVYVETGTYESKIFSTGIASTFNRFQSSVSQPANSSIRFQVAVANPGSNPCTAASYSYVGPNGDPSAYFIPSGSTISGTIPFGTYGGFQNPGKCIRYKLFFDTTDFSHTPVFSDYQINYSP